MRLAFLNPGFLWATALVAVPILIHLLHRRRVRKVEFPAIAFLLRSQARHARRLKLKRILLLAARSVLLLALPLALARPHWAPEEVTAATGGPGPTAVAVVLDTSMSMRYRLGGDPLFERARRKTLDLLDGLGPEDSVAVLPCADGWEGPLPTTTYDLGEARERVRAAEPGFGATDLSACVGAAAQVLGETPLVNKRLVVVTDLTAAAWHLDAPPPRVATEAGEVAPEVVLVDAADGRPLPNRWVEDLSVEPALSLGPRGQAFAFGVRAAGGASADEVPVTLTVGERPVARGFLSLPENGTARKTLAHAFDDGGEVVGAVRLEPDALPVDDARPFALQVRRDLRVLVVDGEPSTDRRLDEVFFVERALQPGRGASALSTRVVDADGFEGVALAGFDAVLMLNVRAVSPERAAALDAFVREGGGLFVSAGDRLDPDAWNGALGGLLPARLHIPKAAEGGPAPLSAVRWDHPVFTVFQGPGREGFASARFEQWLLTRPPRPGATVLATFEDGAPALVAAPHGEGRVVLFTSTVDLEWSDFALRTAFLPTLQQLVGWLSRSLDERREVRVPVGARHGVAVPEGAQELVVVTPEGRRVGFKGEALAQAKVAFDQTGVPGVYRVLVRGEGDETLRPAPTGTFVVEPPAGESDTTRLEAAELLAALGGGEARGAVAGGGDGGGDRAPLWPWFLGLAALAVVAEGFLLR